MSDRAALEIGVTLFIGIIVSGLIIKSCAGCKPAEAPPLPAYCTDEGALGRAFDACRASASTRDESELCRKGVLASCGIVQAVRQ